MIERMIDRPQCYCTTGDPELYYTAAEIHKRSTM